MVQRFAGGPSKVDRRYRQARTSYEPSRAAPDAAGVSGAKDRRGDHRRPPVCGAQHHRNDPENRTAPALERATASSGTPIDSRWRSCLRPAFFPRTLPRKMSAGLQMDMPKSRTENFDRFLPSAASGGILRVHRLHVNCAPRADFIASPKCRETCQTVWRREADSNRRDLLRLQRRNSTRSFTGGRAMVEYAFILAAVAV